MDLLTNPIRRYAWGSRTAIAAIQGRVPSGDVEAELWVGAHPGDPSLVDGVPLDRLIAEDPLVALGERVHRSHGCRLPFLAKILAAEEPLSLQVHPDPEQAAAGYAAEESRGIPQGAPDRRYQDPYAKPELLIALEPFEALCGFRPPAEAAGLFEPLVPDVPGLAEPLAALRAADLGAATATVLAAADPKGLVAGLGAAAARLAEAGRGDVGAYRWVAALAERHPGDPGVALILLTRLLRLAPGQGVYHPAGMVHAYLRGVGVEVMSASDNTLRAGLTPKYVDVPEVLRLLRFTDEPPLVIEPVPVRGTDARLVRWPAPAAEFAVLRVRPDGRRMVLPDLDGPAVLLGVSGAVTAGPAGHAVTAGAAGRADPAGSCTVGGGQAAWLPAATGPVAVAGTGTAFVVAVPQ